MRRTKRPTQYRWNPIAKQWEVEHFNNPKFPVWTKSFALASRKSFAAGRDVLEADARRSGQVAPFDRSYVIVDYPTNEAK